MPVTSGVVFFNCHLGGGVIVGKICNFEILNCIVNKWLKLHLLRSKRSKIANIPVFSIVFYRKHSKIKRTVFRPCCTWFQGLIFCTEHCLSILEAWWEGQVGTLSFTLKWHDSQGCASDFVLFFVTNRKWPLPMCWERRRKQWTLPRWCRLDGIYFVL